MPLKPRKERPAEIQWEPEGTSPQIRAIECPCGADMLPRCRTLAMEPAGLGHIRFEDAPVLECARCGTWRLDEKNPERLETLAAALLVRRPGRLIAKEIRFLRRWLGLSALEFSRLLGTSNVSVSRWERGKSPIDPYFDGLLRAQTAGALLGVAPAQAAAPAELWLRILGQKNPPPVLTDAALFENTVTIDLDGMHVPFETCERLLARA